MKQNSIDWLVEQLKKQGFLYDLDIEQAKAMHKDEIESAWWTGCDEGASTNKIYPSEDCNGYYNETFNNENTDTTT